MLRGGWLFNSLALACGLVLAAFAATSYRRYRDAFHPAVFLAPLLIAGYSAWPLLLNENGRLENLIGKPEIVRIQSYYLLSLFTLCVGLNWTVKKARLKGSALSPWQTLTNTVQGKRTRKRLLQLSLVLGSVALLAYWSSIANVGGFAAAYSRFKGGGSASSGYIGEATLLAYPAVMIYALYRQGRGLRAVDWMIVLVLVSPNLLQGTFGVRRGPLFISLATLFVTWIVAKGRKPTLRATVLGVGSALLAVVFMWSQRQVWFSNGPVEGEAGLAWTILPDDAALTENDYVSGIGSALVTEHYNAFFWGKRWLVDLIIRPIPRQLWPDKYADVGAFWKDSGNPTGFSELEQVQVLGFLLPRGHSMGVLSDLYSEWWWFGAVVTLALGLFLRWLWMRHRMIGQVWTALFLAAMGLSIYLPTQSFSAWYQRFLIIAFGTYVAWRWIVGRDLRAKRDPSTSGDR